MLQRMTSSISGSGTNTYKLHTALQNETKIPSYELTKMSISGALTNTYVTGGDVMTGSTGGRGYFANQNWVLTGSRGYTNTNNLSVGNGITGSLSEIKAWTTALSMSKFRKHTGWEPKITFEKTMDDLLEYWRKKIKLYQNSMHDEFNVLGISTLVVSFYIFFLF